MAGALAERVVLVLGGTGRQGREIVRRLADCGASPIVASRTKPQWPVSGACHWVDWAEAQDRLACESGLDAVVLAAPQDSLPFALLATAIQRGTAYVDLWSSPLRDAQRFAALTHLSGLRARVLFGAGLHPGLPGIVLRAVSEGVGPQLSGLDMRIDTRPARFRGVGRVQTNQSDRAEALLEADLCRGQARAPDPLLRPEYMTFLLPELTALSRSCGIENIAFRVRRGHDSPLPPGSLPWCRFDLLAQKDGATEPLQISTILAPEGRDGYDVTADIAVFALDQLMASQTPVVNLAGLWLRPSATWLFLSRLGYRCTGDSQLLGRLGWPVRPD